MKTHLSHNKSVKKKWTRKLEETIGTENFSYFTNTGKEAVRLLKLPKQCKTLWFRTTKKKNTYAAPKVIRTRCDSQSQKKHCMKVGMKITLGWLLGLGNEPGQISSLTRQGKVGIVGVNGWKLEVGCNKDWGVIDSSSFWRSLILCSNSFKYSIASARIEALSIYQQKNI